MADRGTRAVLSRFVQSIKRREFYLSEDAFSLILMAPLVLWIAATMIYPVFYGIQLSLTNQRLIGIGGTFVGLANYEYIFGNPAFRTAVAKSLAWTLGNGVLQGIFGLTVGVLLQRAFFGRRAMRVWILLPWIVPTIASAILWKWILSGTYGIVNYVLVKLSILQVGFGFLARPDTALGVSTLINAWRMFPFLSIIVLASLLSIPPEEYEAARMDGAGFWQEMRFITLPYMIPTLTVLGIVGMMWSFDLFDLLWLINQGGPAGATRTLPLLVYELAFRSHFLGRAAAVGVVMMAVLALFMVFFMRQGKGAMGILGPTGEES